jgi:hypothetical protein
VNKQRLRKRAQERPWKAYQTTSNTLGDSQYNNKYRHHDHARCCNPTVPWQCRPPLPRRPPTCGARLRWLVRLVRGSPRTAAAAAGVQLLLRGPDQPTNVTCTPNSLSKRDQLLMSNDCADAQQEAIDDTTYPCSSFAVGYDDSDSSAWALMVSTTPLPGTTHSKRRKRKRRRGVPGVATEPHRTIVPVAPTCTKHVTNTVRN